MVGSEKRFYTIPDKTPITFKGRVIGHTVGEQEVNKPMNCVLYPTIGFPEYLWTGDVASFEITFMEV